MGWRRSKEAKAPLSHTTPEESLAWIEAEELAKHTTSEAGVWIVVEDKVFDVTRFMEEEHPGGKDVVLAFAGKQCDWQFELFHRREHLEQYYDELVVGRMAIAPQNPYPRPPRELKASWRQE